MPQLILIVIAVILAAVFGASFCAGVASNAGCGGGGCGPGGMGSSNSGAQEGPAAVAEAPAQPSAPPAPVAPEEVPEPAPPAPPAVPDKVRVLITGNEIRVNDALVPNVPTAVEQLRQSSGTIELNIPGNASAATASELRNALDANNINYQLAQ